MLPGDGLHPHLHEIAVVGNGLLAKQVLKILLFQLAPPLVVAKHGKHIGPKSVPVLFFLRHGGPDRRYLGRRPAHAIQGHAVVGLPAGSRSRAFGGIVLHGKDVEHHHLRGLIAQGVLQKVVRLPDHLLGASPDGGGNTVVFPEGDGGKILVDLTVPHKEHIVSPGETVVLRRQGAVPADAGIFGDHQGLNKNQRGQPQDQGGAQRNIPFFHGAPPRTGCR